MALPGTAGHLPAVRNHGLPLPAHKRGLAVQQKLPGQAQRVRVPAARS